ncbi:GNAT family N-acetyltransferase [Psychromonas aquimarina]|uniref:GNAT family N-acetyltransferase n=1 Tax=Psychromonas aquimarina TaxID=444919 RepID=UPI0004058651|nr:GNAT family N-acetyltransferase [Psychromonas aquimarina]
MTKKTWKIRKAELSDAHGLSQCMYNAYSRLRNKLGGQDLPPMQLDYQQEIRSYPVWTAYSADTLVGGLILLHEADYTTIANIAVHPDFQGHGLGRGLIEFALKQARLHGSREVRLVTHALLTENISLYSYLGWKEYQRSGSKVLMRKALPDNHTM